MSAAIHRHGLQKHISILPKAIHTSNLLPRIKYLLDVFCKKTPRNFIRCKNSLNKHIKARTNKLQEK